ncbi:MAG: hypothetical protein KIT68_12260 [Phycisphaeraceae bacterium]|nr:hypothetical protein [Phycisphaeraceae bacterium]
MASLPAETWALICLIAAVAVVGMLSVMAGAIQHHEQQKALRKQVRKLQADYAQRLKEMQEAAATMGIALEIGEGVPGEYDLVEERKAA